MKIKSADFDALVEDLVKSLDKFKVKDADKQALLGVLGPMKSDIVTGSVASIDGGLTAEYSVGWRPAREANDDQLRRNAGKPVRHWHSPRYCDRGRRGRASASHWETGKAPRRTNRKSGHLFCRASGCRTARCS